MYLSHFYEMILSRFVTGGAWIIKDLWVDLNRYVFVWEDLIRYVFVWVVTIEYVYRPIFIVFLNPDFSILLFFSFSFLIIVYYKLGLLFCEIFFAHEDLLLLLFITWSKHSNVIFTLFTFWEMFIDQMPKCTKR